MDRCTHDCCYPGISCALGHIDKTACQHWMGSEEDPVATDEGASATSEEHRENFHIPWNGYALGMRDLAILGGRGGPYVIGLVGPPGSGKTSLLAFLYMGILRRGQIGEWSFAGSWTLGGWESVVQHSRWTGDAPPSFPPHTSSAGRQPGILHLALRCTSTGQLRDVMFTDGPGEWFTQWARVPKSPASAGARWVIEHSDALLLLVDSGALAEPLMLPKTRRVTRDLMDRVAAEALSPVAVVWTKDDIEVPEHAVVALEKASASFLPRAQLLRTSTSRPETIEACVARALEVASSPRVKPWEAEPRLSNDPFLAFRGRRGEV